MVESELIGFLATGETPIVLQMERGDVVVLRFKRSMTMNMQGRLRAAIGETFGGHKVVILDEGAELGVLRPGDTAKDVPEDGGT